MLKMGGIKFYVLQASARLCISSGSDLFLEGSCLEGFYGKFFFKSDRHSQEPYQWLCQSRQSYCIQVTELSCYDNDVNSRRVPDTGGDSPCIPQFTAK